MFAGHIFTSAFWRNFWIALRRSRRDRRDRKNVLKFTLWLVVSVAYYGYLVATVAIKTLVGPILLIFIAVFVGMALLPRFFNRRDAKEAERMDADSTNLKVRARLAEDCVILAALLVRTSSESFLKQKVLPPGVEVTTRRTQIDSLKKIGRWETLPPTARDLLLLPDGHWPGEAIYATLSQFETLRCLQWALGVDNSIESLTAMPKPLREAAERLVSDPAKLLAGERLLPSWDLRVERNQADIFFSRCYSEAVGRGHFRSNDEEITPWLTESYQRARQPDVRDILAGVDTISELSDSTLHYLLTVSLKRYQSLNLLIVMQTDSPDWMAWEQFCFPLSQEEAPVAESTIL